VLQGNRMIYVKDHKQRDMFNPFERLGTKRLALLESSWAQLFREEILHNLPVEKLFPLYDEFQGRKTKELYAMLGLVLIQQMEGIQSQGLNFPVAYYRFLGILYSSGFADCFGSA
jgi:hypothetical protein